MHNRRVKFGWKIPSRFGNIATSPQGGFFLTHTVVYVLMHRGPPNKILGSYLSGVFRNLKGGPRGTFQAYISKVFNISILFRIKYQYNFSTCKGGSKRKGPLNTPLSWLVAFQHPELPNTYWLMERERALRACVINEQSDFYRPYLLVTVCQCKTVSTGRSPPHAI